MDLETLVEEIRREHEARDDLPGSELVTREFKPRPRPKTAIISEAAKSVEWANEA